MFWRISVCMGKSREDNFFLALSEETKFFFAYFFPSHLLDW